MAGHLARPTVAAIGGSWMVEKRLVNEGRWDEIERLMREALTAGGAQSVYPT